MVFSEIFSGEIPFDSTECKLLSLEKFVDKLKGGMRPRLPLEVRKLNWLNDLVIHRFPLPFPDSYFKLRYLIN